MEILKDEFDSVIDRLLSCHVGVCTCESGTVSDDTLYSGHRKVVFTFTPVSVFPTAPTFSVILVYAAPSEGMVFVTVEEVGPSAIWSTTLSASDAEVLCSRLMDCVAVSGLGRSEQCDLLY